MVVVFIGDILLVLLLFTYLTNKNVFFEEKDNPLKTQAGVEPAGYKKHNTY
jgi:hypothetical protein